MKRRILNVMCICLMVAMVSGCGSKGTNASGNLAEIREEENDMATDGQVEETGDGASPEEAADMADEGIEEEGAEEKNEPATIELLNSLGTLYRRTSYNKNGEISSMHEFNEAREIVYGEIYVGGSLQSTIETEYDAAGNQVKWAQTFADGSKRSEYRYAYDAAGNQIKYEYYTNGEKDFAYDYVIGEDGRIIECNQYNGGRLSYRFAYSYEFDEAGNVVRELQEYYDASGTYRGVYTYEYEYDDENNQIKNVCYNNDGSVYSMYEYDAEGNLLCRQLEGEDYVEYFERNEAGFETKYSRYSLAGGYISSREDQYEYDAERNILIVNKYNGYGDFIGWDEEEYR